MTRELRDALARVAEQAPVAEVPADTWTLARRARARDRALVLATAAAVLALVAGVALLPRAERSAPVAGGATPGVPARIWGVPERLTMQTPDGSWSSDLVESDLAVGRAAAAYVTDGGLPVVVGADDGAYHLVDLPGFLGKSAVSRDSPALSLSPDGRQLAYGWSGPVPDSDATPMPSGVRVVDLASGDVRTIRLSGGRGVLVDLITWSPDSSWLVWHGRVATYWTGSSSVYRSSATGRIAPGATTSEEVTSGDREVVVTVDDAGVVSLLSSDRVTTWDGHPLGRLRIRGSQPVSSAAVRPSGGLAAVGSGYGADEVASVDLTNGRVLTHRYLAGLYPGGADNRPLGWIDDDLLVTLVTPRSDEGSPDQQIVVTTPRRGLTSTYRIVGHVDPAVPGSLSVAVDLMTLARPTVDRPEPDWPWSDERKALVIGLGAAGALALLVLALRLRRRLHR